jgi:hypothetical protein
MERFFSGTGLLARVLRALQFGQAQEQVGHFQARRHCLPGAAPGWLLAEEWPGAIPVVWAETGPRAPLRLLAQLQVQA